MQHLTLRQLIDDNRKAHAEGRLGAQNAFRIPEGGRKCLYRYEGDNFPPNCGCAIGVSLTDETVTLIRQQDKFGAEFVHLLTSNLVTSDRDEAELINLLQKVHDRWATKPNDPIATILHEYVLRLPEDLQTWLDSVDGRTCGDVYLDLLTQMEKYA